MACPAHTYYPIFEPQKKRFKKELTSQKTTLNGRSGYLYGFNGKETDTETDLQDYGMRIYNPSLGRFLSVDPIAAQYPELTPYQFASNRPIDGIDLDGLEWKVITHWYDSEGNYVKTEIKILDNVDIVQNLAVTSVHYAYLVTSLPVKGKTDLAHFEYKYTPGGMRPSTEYNYLSEKSMQRKQADDAQYLLYGTDGNIFSRYAKLLYRDYNAPDNQGTVDDVTTAIFAISGNPYSSRPTAGRNYLDDIFQIKLSKGNTGMKAGTAEDAITVGKSWVNGDKVRMIKLKDGMGWTDGTRTFRLQWKPKEGKWQANFEENILNERTGEIIKTKNVHMDVTDLPAPK